MRRAVGIQEFYTPGRRYNAREMPLSTRAGLRPAPVPRPVSPGSPPGGGPIGEVIFRTRVTPHCRPLGTATAFHARTGRSWPWKFLLVEYKRLEPGHRYAYHRHPEDLYELYVVMAGRVRLAFEGRAAEELADGRAVLLGPAPRHTMEAPAGARVLNLHFPLSRRAPWNEVVRRLASRPFALSRFALDALRGLVALHRSPEALRPYAAHALLAAALLDAAGRMEDAPATTVDRRAVGPLAVRLAWLLDRRPEATHRNAAIARALNLSVRALETGFRRETGETLHRALVRLRLERAFGLLASGERSVKRIAVECGFPDPSYFIRVFRRAYGVTPGAWHRESSRPA